MKRHEMESTYCSASCSDRFEFIYDNYSVFVNILKSKKACFIYMLEAIAKVAFSYKREYKAELEEAMEKYIEELSEMEEDETW